VVWVSISLISDLWIESTRLRWRPPWDDGEVGKGVGMSYDVMSYETTL